LSRPGLRARINLHTRRIGPGHNVRTRAPKLLPRLVAPERITDAVRDRKHATFVDVQIKVTRARCDHDHAPPRFHPHALKTFRMSADFVNGYAWRQFFNAVVEFHAVGEHFSHH